MRKILAGLLYAGLSFSGILNTDSLNLSNKEINLFIKAYLQGLKDAYQDFAYEERKTLSLLKDVYITKKLIKEGDLKIVVKTKVQPDGENGFRIVKVYTFEVIKPEELAKDKAFIKRIEEKYKAFDDYSGYWLYMRIDNIPKPFQGLIEFALTKEGLKPRRFGKILLAGIFQNEAEAKMWQKLIKEKYKIDFAIGVVNGEKTLDPVIQSVLNELY